jgi:hypothetical protein
LQHKAQTRIVAFAFDAIEAMPTTFEADPLGFTQAHAVGGPIGPCGEGLSGHGVQMVSDPATVGGLSEGVQAILGEPVLLAQLRESGVALLFVGAWKRTGTYPFSDKFAWVADKYGVSWQLNLERN